MYNFSIHINDRLAPSLAEQIRACNELQLPNLEIDDQIDGCPLTEMTGSELEEVRNALLAHHKKIVLINGSRPASDETYYIALLAKAFALNAEHIRIATSGQSEDMTVAAEAIRRILPAARSYGIGLVIENAAASPLPDDRTITTLYRTLGSDSRDVGLIFNPLEHIRNKAHPFFHAFYNSKLKGAVRFLRINDGLFADGTAAYPGEGNAEIKELASILLSRSYKGYFSIAPYHEHPQRSHDVNALETFKALLRQL